jgi:hypothetical protein
LHTIAIGIRDKVRWELILSDKVTLGNLVGTRFRDRVIPLGEGKTTWLGFVYNGKTNLVTVSLPVNIRKLYLGASEAQCEDSRVLFLASEYVSKQVRVVPSINRPTRVNPSVFCSLKKEP